MTSQTTQVTWYVKDTDKLGNHATEIAVQKGPGIRLYRDLGPA